MPNITLFSSLLHPQLKVIESADSGRVLPLASHVTIYVLGAYHATTNLNIPTLLTGYSNFTTVYGVPSTTTQFTTADAIRLIYENDTTANVYFINVGATAANYVSGITNLDVEDEYPSGFLIAPAAFKHLTVAADRITVANAMVAKAEQLDWMAFLDNADALNIPAFTPSAVKADADQYTAAARGHAAYYFPYVTESLSGLNRTVPSSAVAASVATARIKVEGFKPNGGLKYPIKGVVAPVVQVLATQQDALDPFGINCIRNFRQAGTVVWGMRTRQTALLYRYVHYRVIANVVNRTFRDAIDLKMKLFDVIDGQGQLFSYLEDAAYSVGRQLYTSGFLFGATETDAFAAKCDFENNTPAMIQQGFVYVEFTYSISPAVDKMIVNTRLTNIGTVAASSDAGKVLLS